MTFIVFCLLLCAPEIYAENNISFRLGPAFDIPMGLPQLNTGIGGFAALDWTFWPLARNLNFGVNASGEFVIIPVKTGDSFSFAGGRLGPFVTYSPFDRWSFNAGLNAGIYQISRDNINQVKVLGSVFLGADFHMSPYFSLFVQGDYTLRVFSEGQPFPSVRASAGLRINYTEMSSSKTRIELDKTAQFRVFPVSWAWYEHNPVATVKIVNDEPNAITDVSLSFYMESFMAQPYIFANIQRLESGASMEIPVTALFSEVMLNLTENVNANGVIQVDYRSLGAQKDASFPVQMPVFHRNTMSWDDDRRAAAFVSPHDSAARIFVRYVAHAVDIRMEQAGTASALSAVPKNVRYAAAMFEALRLYGISYVVVPATSYVNLHADESALDNLTYPYETLYYRGGDCTYISILFCSLLEALNIETAFITIPGHLFMAFNVGNNDWMAGNANIIEIDGSRWLPVEITVPEEGFVRAWRIAAREWSATGAGAALYPIRDCWKI
ncbi:MAG: transglutaminase-like domain-containing protein, partial [Treponema sp.]|nr:transglutaminase-like domain-containing protein [Treponema sp.]